MPWCSSCYTRQQGPHHKTGVGHLENSYQSGLFKLFPLTFQDCTVMVPNSQASRANWLLCHSLVGDIVRYVTSCKFFFSLCVVSCKLFLSSVYWEFRQIIKDSSRSGPRVDFHTRHTGLRRLRSWITVPKTGNLSCSSCKLQTSPSRFHFLLTLHVHFLPRGRPERSSPHCCLFVCLFVIVELLFGCLVLCP